MSERRLRIAAAVARLGLRSAWISALPDNAWGERVRRELTGHGVDCAHVRMMEGARMGVYFVEYGSAPRPVRVLYDRRESALSRLQPDDIDWDVFRRARVVHLTGITPALSATARAVVEREWNVKSRSVAVMVTFALPSGSPVHAAPA